MPNQRQINAVNPTDHYSVISNSTTKRDARGFTLIEMLIALVILSVSILAMTSMTLTAIRTNLDNDLRNAAIRLTAEVAEDLGALPIESVVATGTPETRQVSIRGGVFPYQVTRTVTPLSNDLRQVNITVSYTSKGVTKTNSAVVYKHRAS
jgi:prepilin-type N-terminal cleavage/methylation domain-containing protein